jgi:phage-related protein
VDEPPKPVRWMGESLKNLRSFPETVRQHLGFQLELVQHGMEPTDWKPMSTVGTGVGEI